MLQRWELEAPFTDWHYISNAPALHDTIITLGPVIRKTGDSLVCYAGYGTARNRAYNLTRTAASTDNGGHWEIGSLLSDSVDATFMQVTSEEGVTRLFLRKAASPYSLLMSTDAGLSWRQLADFPTNGIPIVLAQSNETLYVETGNEYLTPNRILRSRDFGDTWETLGTGMLLPGLTCFGNDLYVLMDSVGFDIHVWRWHQYVWEDRGSIPEMQIQWDYPGFMGIPGPQPLLICYPVFGDTTIYTSADSGLTWDPRRIEIPHINQSDEQLSLTWDPYRVRLWAVTGLGVCYLDTFELAIKDKPLVFKPADYTILSAYPNPFNSTTAIRFDLLKRQQVKLDLYDVQGRLVRTLCDEVKEAGRQELRLEGEGLASGVYFVRLKSAEQTKTQKILLLK
jgi:hypothetical protein